MLSLQTHCMTLYDQLAWSDDCTGDGDGVNQHGVVDAENVEDGNEDLIEGDICHVVRGPSPVAFPCSDTPCKTLPPPNYRCPLTLRLMADPVVDSCGHCFDRDAISNWLAFNSICPISRKPLSSSDLIPARTLHERIQHWHTLHGSFDSLDDLSLRFEPGTFSQIELMLLPQERKVLTLIKSRQRMRAEQRSSMQFLWYAAAVTTVTTLSCLLALLYSYHVALRGPL